MSRFLVGMAVLLLAATSASAGELDDEFGKKTTKPARSLPATIVDSDVEEWLDGHFPMGSELDDELPTQSNYRWRGSYGWGGYRGYGYGGYRSYGYGGYRGYGYGGYRGYGYGGYRGYGYGGYRGYGYGGYRSYGYGYGGYRGYGYGYGGHRGYGSYYGYRSY